MKFAHIMKSAHTVQLSRCFERTRICPLRVVASRGLSLLASDSRVTRKLRAILRDHLANAQNHLSNARRESDMRDLYNLNNLARKVCCKKKKSFMLNFHARLMSTCMSNLIALITAWSLQVFILNTYRYASYKGSTKRLTRLEIHVHVEYSSDPKEN